MGYLTKFDYIARIQDSQLNQIISNNTKVLSICENLANDIFKSKLTQKYDVIQEFNDTEQYSATKIYNADYLVYLDGVIYSNTDVYTSNTTVIYNDIVYLRNSYNTGYVAGILPTNTTYFSLLGNLYEFYNTKLPYAYWDYEVQYKRGTNTFYKNKIYTAISDNYGVQPDDVNLGTQYWGSGTDYTVPAGNLLNTTYFQKGDNRNIQCVEYMIDVVIFEIMTRLPQKQIPEFRKQKYDTVMEWLQDVSTGATITLNIPRLPYRSGSRIRYNSNVKNINSY